MVISNPDVKKHMPLCKQETIDKFECYDDYD